MKRCGPLTLVLAVGIFVLNADARPANKPPIVHATGYAAMLYELQRDASLSPLVKILTIGSSARFHRPIVLVQVGTPGPAKVRIMILCRQHGDEPSGTEAALAFINGVALSPSKRDLLPSSCFYFVPMVNPDGAEAGTRLNGYGADLNRDWGIFRQPETVAVRNAVQTIRPAFILDVHSWDMIDPFQQVCLEGPRQAPVSPKLMLSVADLQARASYGLAARVKQTVAATTYGVYSDPSLAHRYFLRSDHLASLLFETGPGPNYGESLAARTALVESLFQWLLTDTTLHQDAWKRLSEAEPQPSLIPGTTIAGTALAKASRAVESHPVKKNPWLPLIFACSLVGWLALKSKPFGLIESSRETASNRRFRSVFYLALDTSRKRDLKARRRIAAERAALQSALNYRGKIHFSRRYHSYWLKVSE